MFKISQLPFIIHDSLHEILDKNCFLQFSGADIQRTSTILLMLLNRHLFITKTKVQVCITSEHIFL